MRVVELLSTGLHQSRPVLQRLCQVSGLDAITAGQVGDGAGQLEDAVIGTRRELQLVHGRAHQGAAGIIQLGKLSHLGWAHIRIAGDGASNGRSVR